MSFGLVLGAGGAKAWVFHTGVLDALQREFGINAAEADLIVGTSAGASIAAAVRAGLGVDEIHEMVTRPPTQEDRDALRSELRSAPKSLRPLAPRLARELLPGGRGATLALAGMLPPGWFPTSWLASLPGMGSFRAWPDGLWVPAVRVADGELLVFGRDRTDVPVHVAVEASSAVPGIFRPRYIDGVAFVDGGIVSSTHADLTGESGVEKVIISAPMTGPAGRLFVRNARQRLASEVATLRSAGLEVAVVQPSAEAAAAARGYPRRRPEAATSIVDHAVEATRLALASA